MILRTAYVRFYRAFNYDYLRKRHPEAKPAPWDSMEDGTFYPYVSLDIDPELTAVVGANESGKSQLLQAIECALGEDQPEPADFCRYSVYFTVAEAMRLPHFGLHFDDLTEHEVEVISSVIGSSDLASGGSFRLFRTKPDAVTIYVGEQPFEISDASALEGILPNVFRIDAARAIPDSVPIAFIIARGKTEEPDPGPPRKDRLAFLGPMVEHASDLFGTPHNAESFAQTLQNILGDTNSILGTNGTTNSAYRSQLNLAFDLLVTVGGINLSAFSELRKALDCGDEGLVNGIVSSMNEQLAISLNLSKWWSQDDHFRLALTVRDFDISFTIKDRTGSEYSFAERSSGLKYFLSYLVQFLAHMKSRNQGEILLMDEPDAYLSNQGQQDLLRLLQEFALPSESGPIGQVLYVTHSPFLIDKNRADRIRVLDKGSGDEGARVVRDVGRNHFEPLRTALGSFVGETAFIGNCNIMLEGVADQIYLAGMSDLLKKEGAASTECLDLNRVTLVPAGSASHVPYLTYLARGRDANRPAIIVLLDGDKGGDDAAKQLQRGGARYKQLIPKEYVTQLKPGLNPAISSDRPAGPVDLEDLVPVEIGIAAARAYLDELDAGEVNVPSADEICSALTATNGVFQAIRDGVAQAGSDVHLEKVGFARHAVVVCAESDTEAASQMRARFAALFSHLTAMQRKAERERERESITARVDREVAIFLRDRLSAATKVDVVMLIERIEAVIDVDAEGDQLVRDLRRLRQDFELDRNLSDAISDIPTLQARLESLKYAEILASQPKAPEAESPVST
ncbi:MAG: AAA family ATPase [Chloroflexi bacterium]|nr:AAA family ATPase [Chloroflexota bacterium]